MFMFKIDYKKSPIYSNLNIIQKLALAAQIRTYEKSHDLYISHVEKIYPDKIYRNQAVRIDYVNGFISKELLKKYYESVGINYDRKTIGSVRNIIS